MTTLIEAAQQALEALESAPHPIRPYIVKMEEAITALRQAIEQAEKQEPVATVQCINGLIIGYLDVMQPVGTKLYTSPPQRQPLTLEQLRKHWPLTLEQLRKHWQVAKVLDMTDDEIDFADYVLIARDVEALYGIKGEA